MGKEKWREAKDYPDIDSLSMSYHRRSNEAVKTLLEYVGATMVFAIALYAVSKESLVVVGGMLFFCVYSCGWRLKFMLIQRLPLLSTVGNLLG